MSTEVATKVAGVFLAVRMDFRGSVTMMAEGKPGCKDGQEMRNECVNAVLRSVEMLAKLLLTFK